MSCFGLGNFWDYPVRLMLSHYFQNEYGEHVYRCDNAMREHFIAKGRAVNKLNENEFASLSNAEVALIDCHEYDKFRKMLLRYGLNENDLATMGLIAIEAKASDIHTLVREHEIRY